MPTPAEYVDIAAFAPPEPPRCVAFEWWDPRDDSGAESGAQSADVVRGDGLPESDAGTDGDDLGW